jgi:purine-binding chemotaxis protein CheW
VDAVLVPVSDDIYAVPIGWVREVVAAPPLTPLVTAPPMVLGLFNLRGEIVPLLDTASALGLAHPGPVTFAVVLHTALGPVGLSATATPRRMLLEEDLGPSELANTEGSYRVEDTVALLLDVQALLDSLTPHAVARDDGGDVHATELVGHS